MPLVREIKKGLLLNIVIKPNSRENQIKSNTENIIVFIKSPPVKGKANKELLIYLSSVFKLSKTQLSIISGHKSKNKTILIENSDSKQKEEILNILKSDNS
ncbi:MAG: YggU family protein [Candidatus Lokiarchaeota archaeon]|nr:YggU family protein [Candidatus Lokiarchaeota archaeon]